MFIFRAAGAGYANVVKTTVFMRDIRDYGDVNEAYVKFFDKKPARSAFQVSALPLGAAVEIEAVAVID